MKLLPCHGYYPLVESLAIINTASTEFYPTVLLVLKFIHTNCLLTAPYCLLTAVTQPIQGLPLHLLLCNCVHEYRLVRMSLGNDVRWPLAKKTRVVLPRKTAYHILPSPKMLSFI